jgi:hypothetical protein
VGTDDFDFAPYPKLLSILRTSKLLEESATLMGRSDAASFLTGMRAREESRSCSARHVCCALCLGVRRNWAEKVGGIGQYGTDGSSPSRPTRYRTTAMAQGVMLRKTTSTFSRYWKK